VPSRAFRMRIDVLEPMDPNRLASDVTSPSIAARSIAREVEVHITQSLFQYGYFKTAN